MVNVKVTTSDNSVYTLEPHVVQDCAVLKDLIDLTGCTDDEEVPVVPKAKTMENFIKFFEFFRNEPVYVRPVDAADAIRLPLSSPIMMYLSSLKPDEVMELEKAANYFNSSLLIDHICAFFLNQSRSGNIALLRSQFGFRTKVSAKEDKKLKKKHTKRP